MTKKLAKVIMPKDPPYDVLVWMAGSPLILSASDEQAMRKWYDVLRRRLALRKDRT